ncbi:MAG: SPOR domain-containing protein [Gammaproteobacteria bacterium]|nr:SPOR domain-containing protein [Gammaproteobacteria bacterium]
MWLAAGLVIGLFVAFLIWLDKRPSLDHVPEPAVSVEPAPAAKPEQKTSTKEKNTPSASTAPTASKPRFDFYTILPEMEVIIPDKELKKRAANDAQAGKAESYFLQAGSFKNLVDADALKANLALLGIEAKIQSVSVENDTWHRVRMGPYSDMDQLNKVRAQLRQNNINAIPLKAKG